MRAARNIVHLGVKELRGLVRDPLLLLTIILAFTVVPYASTTALTDTLHKAPLAVVDEDQSQLSRRIIGAFYPPAFLAPIMVTGAEVDRGMDAGRYTFALQIPPNFQSDVLAGHSPATLLNVDATRMSQAFVGAGHIQQIVTAEANEFIAGYRAPTTLPVELATRVRFNPELNPAWFVAIMQLMDQVTLLSIILTGAALIREREYGTVEHLLVMPVTPFEIMAAKMWSMGLVILVTAALSLKFVVQGLLAVPIEGSIALFIAGAALHLFATTSMGIFLGTYARTMPQFGLLVILIIMPLQNLSGGQTPRESMPEFVQFIMQAAPTTHFVMLAQSILYRGAGFAVAWPQFIALFVIGCILFALSLARFRKTLAALV